MVIMANQSISSVNGTGDIDSVPRQWLMAIHHNDEDNRTGFNPSTIRHHSNCNYDRQSTCASDARLCSPNCPVKAPFVHVACNYSNDSPQSLWSTLIFHNESHIFFQKLVSFSFVLPTKSNYTEILFRFSHQMSSKATVSFGSVRSSCPLQPLPSLLPQAHRYRIYLINGIVRVLDISGGAICR